MMLKRGAFRIAGSFPIGYSCLTGYSFLLLRLSLRDFWRAVILFIPSTFCLTSTRDALAWHPQGMPLHIYLKCSGIPWGCQDDPLPVVQMLSEKESSKPITPSTVAVNERPCGAHRKTLLSGIIHKSGTSPALVLQRILQ